MFLDNAKCHFLIYRKKSHFQWQLLKLLSHPKQPAQKAPNPSHISTQKNFFSPIYFKTKFLGVKSIKSYKKIIFVQKNIFSGIWACFHNQTNLTSWWVGRQFLWVPPLTYAQEFIVSLQGSSKIQSRPQASPMQQMIQKIFWELPSLFPVDLKVFSNFWHSL